MLGPERYFRLREGRWHTEPLARKQVIGLPLGGTNSAIHLGPDSGEIWIVEGIVTEHGIAGTQTPVAWVKHVLVTQPFDGRGRPLAIVDLLQPAPAGLVSSGRELWVQWPGAVESQILEAAPIVSSTFHVLWVVGVLLQERGTPRQRDP